MFLFIWILHFPKVAVIVELYGIFVCPTTWLSPVLFMCCVCEDRLPCTCLSLCLCWFIVHVFNLLRTCIHHIPPLFLCVCGHGQCVCGMTSVFVWRGWTFWVWIRPWTFAASFFPYFLCTLLTTKKSLKNGIEISLKRFLPCVRSAN